MAALTPRGIRGNGPDGGATLPKAPPREMFPWDRNPCPALAGARTPGRGPSAAGRKAVPRPTPDTDPDRFLHAWSKAAPSSGRVRRDSCCVEFRAVADPASYRPADAPARPWAPPAWPERPLDGGRLPREPSDEGRPLALRSFRTAFSTARTSSLGLPLHSWQSRRYSSYRARINPSAALLLLASISSCDG